MIAKLGRRNVIESLTLVAHEEDEHVAALVGGVSLMVTIGADGGSYSSASEIIEGRVVLRLANIGERAFDDFTVTVGREKRHLLVFVDAAGAPGSRGYRITLTMAEG